ncbi:sensor histidine kinase [Pseudoalteromonas sp. BMB]|uniref:sensor histidine kinase n=1 Tax=Pseudoalteromonas sp. BMB TaxID=1874619 RepID=UPI0020C7E64D|nr:HAMP domain-containing sensor histidine kinase [Pseudoalteromonas sp. BMB]
MWHLELWAWKIVIVTSLLALGYIVAIVRFRNVIVASFQRALLHIEAIRQEDYKQYAKPAFPKGVVGKFHLHLREFSQELSEKKQRYDQHAFLVYQLIDQQDNPVMVLNHKYQLVYANGAFSQLYDGQPWQRYKHASTKLLGLRNTKSGWQLKSQNQNQSERWQINQSAFIDSGLIHQLLVFTNIESAVRSSQVKAWQLMINVMGHEIRNSLTPVSTIAETLAARVDNERDQAALALISERCQLLLNFINHYASLSKKITLKYEVVSTERLVERLTGLFSHLQFEVIVKIQQIYVDKSAIEQVLINLIKNADEAGANIVTLSFHEERGRSFVKVVDNGHGFANLENSFVPLFTTKPEGQGIGLCFCRNTIEQHQGKIDLENNLSGGVTVTITLPQQS